MSHPAEPTRKVFEPLLRQWARELRASELAERHDLSVVAPDWLGTAPADEATLAATEARLGLRLPPSYRGFLATSDGWGPLSPFVDRLRSAAEIDWYVVENQEAVDIWTSFEDEVVSDKEYFDYAANPAAFRASELKHALLISAGGDGDVLLNPRAVLPGGEWECWFLAAWVPGAKRYASFLHWLVSEHESFRDLYSIDAPLPALPTTELPPPTMTRFALRPRFSQADATDELK